MSSVAKGSHSESHIAFSFHVSLVSFNLVYFQPAIVFYYIDVFEEYRLTVFQNDPQLGFI